MSSPKPFYVAGRCALRFTFSDDTTHTVYPVSPGEALATFGRRFAEEEGDMPLKTVECYIEDLEKQETKVWSLDIHLITKNRGRVPSDIAASTAAN